MSRLALKAETAVKATNTIPSKSSLLKDAKSLARKIFKETGKADEFARSLLDVCARARGNNFLIVHNPGGWGHARLQECLEWEKDIVAGVADVIRNMDYTVLVTQYFRSGYGWQEEVADFRELLRFFPNKSAKMAAWLRFIIDHVDNIKIILVGVSQGAAFGNAVMQSLGANCPVYSIELGFPFLYKSRRAHGAKTLEIDNNGEQTDKLVEGTIFDAMGIFLAAPFKWLWYRMEGNHVSFPHCVNTPGHAYDWGNAYIRNLVKRFLETNFAVR